MYFLSVRPSLGDVCVGLVIPVGLGLLDDICMPVFLGWSVPVDFPLNTVVWLKFCESSDDPAAKLSALVGHGGMNLPNGSAAPSPVTDNSAS